MEKTPAQKGVRTFVQTLGGALIGLLVVIWGVPGVPQAAQHYLVTNLLPLMLGISLPAGVLAWAQNKLGR